MSSRRVTSKICTVDGVKCVSACGRNHSLWHAGKSLLTNRSPNLYHWQQQKEKYMKSWAQKARYIASPLLCSRYQIQSNVCTFSWIIECASIACFHCWVLINFIIKRMSKKKGGKIRRKWNVTLSFLCTYIMMLINTSTTVCLEISTLTYQIFLVLRYINTLICLLRFTFLILRYCLAKHLFD